MDRLVEESLRSKIGENVRGSIDKSQTRKNWNTKHGKRRLSVYEANKVTDKDFDIIADSIRSMKESTRYSEYKKHLNTLCKMCMIPFDGLIIQRYSLRRGKKPNENYVLITYANTRQKITIPQGSSLYHSSTLDNLKELKPFFQGKAARGYMYSAPRIYLTIRKNMNPLMADLKPTQKRTLYKVKENIRTAYVDPLVPGFMDGAVYVETQFPIAIEKVVGKTVKESVDEDVNFIEEDIPKFVSLEEFCEYYGLEIVDEEHEDLMEESFMTTVGKVSRHMEHEKDFRNMWKDLAHRISHKVIKKEVKTKDYQTLHNSYNIMKSSRDYSTYKKAYETICKFFNLKAPETSIKYIKFDEVVGKKNTWTVELSYNSGRRQVMIPNGSMLIYTSSKSGIKELEPTFCSKKAGYFMWPTKRVYFSLARNSMGKDISISKNTKKFKYTPVENIRNVYIDVDSPSVSMGSVYVDTRFPIRVKCLNALVKGILNK